MNHDTRHEEAETKHGRPEGLHGLTEGESVWVQPFAMIEDTRSRALFVDPRFAASEVRSPSRCIELTMTDSGLVAAGPSDAHRLRPVVDRRRFLPVARLDARD